MEVVSNLEFEDLNLNLTSATTQICVSHQVMFDDFFPYLQNWHKKETSIFMLQAY